MPHGIPLASMSLTALRRSRLLLVALLAGALGLAAGIGALAQERGPVTVYPADGARDVWPGSTVQVRADRELDPDSLRAAFRISPDLPGELSANNGSYASFQPDEPLDARAGYTVTIGTELRDARGNPLLDEPLVVRFETGEDNARVSFQGALPLRFVDPDGARDVPFDPGYPRATLELSLYRITEPQLVERYLALQPWSQSQIDLEGLELLESWSQHVIRYREVDRPRLPETLPPGLYVLDARSARVDAGQAIVVLGDHAAVAKHGLDGLSLWLSHLPEGLPGAGGQVRLYDADGALIGEATTDADGLAHLADDAGGVLAVAEVDGRPTIVGLDDAWRSGGYWGWWRMPLPAGEGLRAEARLAGHVHADRPIYRPGHTVHWKASLRSVEPGGYALPAPDLPVTVTVRDPGGSVVATIPTTPDDFGSVYGDLPLDEDAALGAWRVAVTAEGRGVEGSFRVEEYVKPDYEVTVETDRPWYVRGQSAEVRVQADYYFGQPAAGAEVTLRVYRGTYSWRGEDNRPVFETSGTTDPDGALTVDLPLEGQEGGSVATWIEAEVVDASRRPVVADAQVTVHPAHFRLALTNERYGIEAGQPVRLEASAIGHDGVGRADQAIDVELRQYRRGGYEVLARESLRTGQDGTADLSFPDLEPGWYQLQALATDQDGNRLQASSYAWIWDTAQPWWWWGGLELELDRDAYAPGATARLLVKSPVTGTALVTIEREEVFEEIVVEVSGAAEVELPIEAAYAPNAWVHVGLWQLQDDASNAAPARLLTASRKLVVPAEDRRLTVEVLPDAAEHAPRDEAAITLRVTDAEGRPVEAQLSLALVDKAVLALAQDMSGDPFDAFWRDWPNEVSTFDSLRPAESYWPEDRADAGGPPPAGPSPQPTPAPGAQDPDDEPSQSTPRREFPDTAYWRADLETDEQGEVVVRLDLPDNLTTWVAAARAIDRDTRAGRGEGEILVSQPLIADLAMPRFAVQGDRFALDLLARNYATPGSSLDASCTLSAPGLVALDAGARELDLPFNQTAFARWSVVASSLGSAPVLAELTTTEGGDAIELPLEVHPFAVPERIVRAGGTEAKTLERFDVPYNAVPDGSSLEVRLSPGAALSVLDGVEELIGYPYGCTEQTMSRMLPNAVVGRLVEELGVDAPEIEAELPEYMTIGLQKLYGFQNADGSWGWWRQTAGQTYLTAYVLHGLSLTAEAGFEVDADVLTRGYDWLAANLAAEKDLRMRAYALFVLAEGGRETGDAALDVFDERGGLDAFARSVLAIALEAAGHEAEAAALLDELIAAAEVSPTTAHWPLAPPGERWDYYHWRSMASTEKSTAAALGALVRLRPGHELAPKAARWLLEHRWGRGWRSTQATAFAILGLTDYLLSSGELDARYDWTLRLDGDVVASGAVTPENVTTPIEPVRIPGSRLSPGTHELQLEKAGEGSLYYTAVADLARYYDGFAPTQAEGLGIELSRGYERVAGRGGDEGWAVGDVVNVRLTLSTREDLWYVMVEDLLPAGFEALNESLGTETSRVPGAEPPWRWWGYERRELRDEKVTFFATRLPAGTHTFEYAARAVTPGEFSARPAVAEAMYRPEVWGRSGSERVSIAAERVAPRPDLAGDFDRDCRLTAFDASLVAEDWAAGVGRDLTGDGRVSVSDVALAGGRADAGLACGQAVPPARAAGATLDLSLTDEGPGAGPGERIVALRVAGDAPVGAWEAALDLPDGLALAGAEAGARLPGAALLLPPDEARTGRVRVAGWAPEDGRDGEVLARLVLRGGTDEAPGLAGAELTTADGRAYALRVDGELLPPPVGSFTLWLPWVAR